MDQVVNVFAPLARPVPELLLSEVVEELVGNLRHRLCYRLLRYGSVFELVRVAGWDDGTEQVLAPLAALLHIAQNCCRSRLHVLVRSIDVESAACLLLECCLQLPNFLLTLSQLGLHKTYLLRIRRMSALCWFWR